MEKTKYNKLFGGLILHLLIFTLVPMIFLGKIKNTSTILIITAIVAFIPTYIIMGHSEFMNQLTQRRERVNPLFIICLALAPMATNIIGGLVEEGIKKVLTLFGLSFFKTTAEMANEIMTMPSLSIILYTCLLAPLFEELVYRNYLSRSIEKPRPWLGICISGLLFALMHTNFDQSISLVPTGIYFGYLALRYSTWVAIAAHVLNNSIFFVSAFLDGRPYGEQFGQVLFFIGIASSVLVGISAFKYFKKNRNMGTGEKAEYLKNPFFWAFIVICIIMMFLNEYAARI